MVIILIFAIKEAFFIAELKTWKILNFDKAKDVQKNKKFEAENRRQNSEIGGYDIDDSNGRGRLNFSLNHRAPNDISNSQIELANTIQPVATVIPTIVQNEADKEEITYELFRKSNTIITKLCSPKLNKMPENRSYTQSPQSEKLRERVNTSYYFKRIRPQEDSINISSNQAFPFRKDERAKFFYNSENISKDFLSEENEFTILEVVMHQSGVPKILKIITKKR